MGLFTERDEETPNQIILGKLNRIEAKLDAVIKALHEYDDDQLHCEYSGLPSVKAYSNEEYGESSFEAFMDETELNKRMDVIGQNGNEGTHYTDVDENEFSDYGMRIAKKVMSDKDNIRVGKDKSNNIQPKQKQYYKNSRSKRNVDKKSAVVEHQKYPPHKH